MCICCLTEEQQSTEKLPVGDAPEVCNGWHAASCSVMQDILLNICKLSLTSVGLHINQVLLAA